MHLRKHVVYLHLCIPTYPGIYVRMYTGKHEVVFEYADQIQKRTDIYVVYQIQTRGVRGDLADRGVFDVESSSERTFSACFSCASSRGVCPN